MKHARRAFVIISLVWGAIWGLIVGLISSNTLYGLITMGITAFVTLLILCLVSMSD